VVSDIRARAPGTGHGKTGEAQTLSAVSAAHLISHFYIMVLPVLLPFLKERLDVGFLELGLALTIFNVVSGLTQAPMGFLVDRIGARTVLVAGLFLGGLAFIALGLVTSYPWLLVTAALAGLANCVYHPADYAILADNVPDNRIGKAFSIHTFAGFLGGAVAPPILLALVALGGLGPALIAAGAAGLLTGCVLLLMPIGSRPHAHAAPGAAQGAKGSVGSVLTPAILSLTGFFTLLALSNSAIYSFSVVALIASQGISLTAANWALTAFLGGSSIGVLIGGMLADRTQRHGDVSAIGFGLTAGIILLVALLTLSAPLVIAAMGVGGLLSGMMMPSRDMLVRKAAPPGSVGRAFGIVSTGFNIGGTVGPMLFGWIMDHGSPRWIFGASCVFMLATALFGFVAERRASARRS
jgi:MFS family permease